MKCEYFRELILDYTSGSLGAELLRNFKVHWTSCTECAEMLRAVEGHEALLAALPRPKPSPELWSRIQRVTNDHELLRVMPFNVRFVRWAVAAAAVALMAVTAIAARPRATAPATIVKAPRTSESLNITIVDVKDRAQAGALGRLVPTYEPSDPAAAIGSVMREK
jgi:anti-sigma-K factor RskA